MTQEHKSSRTSWLGKLRSDLQVTSSYASSAKNAGAAELTAVEVMTIVLEDRRYFRHKGVDLQSLVREAARALQLRRPGGASTIEMQFVRTVTGYRGRTIKRKMREILLAVLLERRCDKHAILRSYLSRAYFGTGLTGADEAAQKVFGRRACDLGLEDAAFLSAMLCYPRPRAAPPEWQAKVANRAAYGLRVYRTDHARLRRNFVALCDEA